LSRLLLRGRLPQPHCCLRFREHHYQTKSHMRAAAQLRPKEPRRTCGASPNAYHDLHRPGTGSSLEGLFPSRGAAPRNSGSARLQIGFQRRGTNAISVTLSPRAPRCEPSSHARCSRPRRANGCSSNEQCRSALSNRKSVFEFEQRFPCTQRTGATRPEAPALKPKISVRIRTAFSVYAAHWRNAASQTENQCSNSLKILHIGIGAAPRAIDVWGPPRLHARGT
jgi:hypothetical protein